MGGGLMTGVIARICVVIFAVLVFWIGDTTGAAASGETRPVNFEKKWLGETHTRKGVGTKTDYRELKFDAQFPIRGGKISGTVTRRDGYMTFVTFKEETQQGTVSGTYDGVDGGRLIVIITWADGKTWEYRGKIFASGNSFVKTMGGEKIAITHAPFDEAQATIGVCPSSNIKVARSSSGRRLKFRMQPGPVGVLALPLTDRKSKSPRLVDGRYAMVHVQLPGEPAKSALGRKEKIRFEIISGNGLFDDGSTKRAWKVDRKGKVSMAVIPFEKGEIVVRLTKILGKTETGLGTVKLVTGVQLSVDKLVVRPVVPEISSDPTHVILATVKSINIPDLLVGAYFDPNTTCAGRGTHVKKIVLQLWSHPLKKTAGAPVPLNAVDYYNGVVELRATRNTTYLYPVTGRQYEQSSTLIFPAIQLKNGSGQFPSRVMIRPPGSAAKNGDPYPELTRQLLRKLYFVMSKENDEGYLTTLACSVEAQGLVQSLIHGAADWFFTTITAGVNPYGKFVKLAAYLCSMGRNGVQSATYDMLVEFGSDKVGEMFEGYTKGYIRDYYDTDNKTAGDYFDTFKERFEQAKKLYEHGKRDAAFGECMKKKNADPVVCMGGEIGKFKICLNTKKKPDKKHWMTCAKSSSEKLAKLNEAELGVFYDYAYVPGKKALKTARRAIKASIKRKPAPAKPPTTRSLPKAPIQRPGRAPPMPKAAIPIPRN